MDGARIWVQVLQFQHPRGVAYKTDDQAELFNCKLLENKSPTLDVSVFPTALTIGKALYG